jgi:hypothetical protein
MGRWVWAAGIGAVVVVALAIWWFASSKSPATQVADTAGPKGPAIEVEQTERFTLPEEEITDIVPEDIQVLPPPGGEEAQTTEPTAEPSAGGPGPQGAPPGGDRLEPRPVEPRGDQRPPPRGGSPPQGPAGGAPPPARTTEIYQPGVGVASPVLMHLAETIYPDGKKPKNEMVVIVSVLVDEFGKVLAANATSGGGFRRRYRDPAVETAKRSAFRPAIKDGVAGRMWTEVRIVFAAE